MPEYGQTRFVEVLAVARPNADPLQKASAPPASNRNWRPQTLIEAARRLRDDLKPPLTLLLIALLALAGCTAKVEVSHETAAQADSEPTEPPAMEKRRTAVEVDLFGQRESEAGAQEVVSENPSAAGAEGEPGNVTVIVVKQVHKHRHYHPPNSVGRRRWMSDADEMEEVRRIHREKLREYGGR
jgi:hypothetical protein